MRNINERNNSKIIRFIIVILSIIIITFLINRMNIFKGYGPNEIKEAIQSKGALAPIIYIVLLSSLPLLLFPDSIIVIAGGMVFGLFWGTILTAIGSLLGATIAFFISKKLGQKVVKKFIKKDLIFFENNNKKRGFFFILMLRLIPLFPFKIVSYSAGLSNIKFEDFALATVLGSLPGIIVYTNLGDKTTVYGSKDFYLSILLLVVLFVFSIIMKKVFKNKGEENINEY